MQVEHVGRLAGIHVFALLIRTMFYDDKSVYSVNLFDADLTSIRVTTQLQVVPMHDACKSEGQYLLLDENNMKLFKTEGVLFQVAVKSITRFA